VRGCQALQVASYEQRGVKVGNNGGTASSASPHSKGSPRNKRSEVATKQIEVTKSPPLEKLKGQEKIHPQEEGGEPADMQGRWLPVHDRGSRRARGGQGKDPACANRSHAGGHRQPVTICYSKFYTKDPLRATNGRGKTNQHDLRIRKGTSARPHTH
jgi:hypothetical protein